MANARETTPDHWQRFWTDGRPLHEVYSNQGRLVEQALAHAILQPADRLADGRLGPVQLHGGPGEAPFGCNLNENAQFAQFHCTTFS